MVLQNSPGSYFTCQVQKLYQGVILRHQTMETSLRLYRMNHFINWDDCFYLLYFSIYWLQKKPQKNKKKQKQKQKHKTKNNQTNKQTKMSFLAFRE